MVLYLNKNVFDNFCKYYFLIEILSIDFLFSVYKTRYKKQTRVYVKLGKFSKTMDVI